MIRYIVHQECYVDSPWHYEVRDHQNKYVVICECKNESDADNIALLLNSCDYMLSNFKRDG